MSSAGDTKIRRDRFYRARGGTATILRIASSSCGSYLCLYQKDGNGTLRRLYRDRVFHAAFTAGYTAGVSRSDMGSAICQGCGQTLGLPMVFAPEEVGVAPRTWGGYQDSPQLPTVPIHAHQTLT